MIVDFLEDTWEAAKENPITTVMSGGISAINKGIEKQAFGDRGLLGTLRGEVDTSGYDALTNKAMAEERNRIAQATEVLGRNAIADSLGTKQLQLADQLIAEAKKGTAGIAEANFQRDLRTAQGQVAGVLGGSRSGAAGLRNALQAQSDLGLRGAGQASLIRAQEEQAQRQALANALQNKQRVQASLADVDYRDRSAIANILAGNQIGGMIQSQAAQDLANQQAQAARDSQLLGGILSAGAGILTGGLGGALAGGVTQAATQQIPQGNPNISTLNTPRYPAGSLNA